jgi:hypothetical protein
MLLWISSVVKDCSVSTIWCINEGYYEEIQEYKELSSVWGPGSTNYIL